MGITSVQLVHQRITNQKASLNCLNPVYIQLSDKKDVVIQNYYLL